MLVVTRKEDETILINDDIEIIIVAIKGKQVRIGVKAPPHVKILRKELKNGEAQERRKDCKNRAGES